jgi:tetratricopeptide (TPR) repeat protein
MEKARAFIPVAGAILIYTLTIPLNALFKDAMPAEHKRPDVIQNMFGGMRSFVGDWAFMKAEEYHHRGLPFAGAASYHHGESTLMSEVNGAGKEEHRDEGAAGRQGLFSRIYRSVKVTEDSHLAPADEKEVLPWFYAEVLFNPHDTRGYVLGGYWLERLARGDESLAFLKEGLKNNPRSARIIASIGSFYYRNGRKQEAGPYLESARSLWLKGAGENMVTDKYAESDRFVAFDELAHLYEETGRPAQALEVYKELHGFSQIKAVEDSIIRLEKNRPAK